MTQQEALQQLGSFPVHESTPGAFLPKPTFRSDEGVRFGAALNTTAALLAHLNLEVQEFDSQHLPMSLHQSRSKAHLLTHAYPMYPYVPVCYPSNASEIYQKVCQFRWEAQCA